MSDTHTVPPHVPVPPPAPHHAPHVGFLEQAPGVRSSTRLFAAILLALTAVLVLTICLYVIRLGKEASAAVLGALGASVTGLVAQGAVAIIRRNAGPHDPPPSARG